MTNTYKPAERPVISAMRFGPHTKVMIGSPGGRPYAFLCGKLPEDIRSLSLKIQVNSVIRKEEYLRPEDGFYVTGRFEDVRKLIENRSTGPAVPKNAEMTPLSREDFKFYQNFELYWALHPSPLGIALAMLKLDEDRCVIAGAVPHFAMARFSNINRKSKINVWVFNKIEAQARKITSDDPFFRFHTGILHTLRPLTTAAFALEVGKTFLSPKAMY